MTKIDEFDDWSYAGDDPEDYDAYEQAPDWQDIPIKCNACYGTGLDRYVDADCIACVGDGFV